MSSNNGAATGRRLPTEWFRRSVATTASIIAAIIKIYSKNNLNPSPPIITMRGDYIDFGYKPNASDIIAEYFIEPAKGCSMQEVVNSIAGESSIDTWTDIKTLKPATARRLKPHVFSIKKNVKIAYPIALFEPGSIAQFLSSLAGNILSMKAVANLRLLDVHFPQSYVKSFQGPRYGIPGIRALLRIPSRPLLGTIVKPKMGLTPREHALVAFEAWVGGVDLVKDDENLTNQTFNPFQERVKATLGMRNRAEKETGSRKMYMVNITAATTEEMLSRAKYVRHLGGEYVMIDLITSGWTAVQSLRNANLGLVLHGHRCMHSALTRNPKHGVSMMVIAKLARLAGLDQLHTGTVIGKMEGSSSEVLNIDEEMEHQHIEQNDAVKVLAQDWYSIKPLLPVASGGLQPLMIPALYKQFGKDIALQFGGGIHAHPRGTRAGAKAAVQALEATLKGIPLQKYATGRHELAEAIRKWGN